MNKQLSVNMAPNQLTKNFSEWSKNSCHTNQQLQMQAENIMNDANQIGSQNVMGINRLSGSTQSTGVSSLKHAKSSNESE